MTQSPQQYNQVPPSWYDPIFTPLALQQRLLLPHQRLLAYHKSHVLAHLPPQATADILTLYTPPDQRRQGHAKSLLKHIILMAKAQGCPALTLEVRASNTPAIALYQSLHFQHIHTRPAYYTHPTEDAYILSLSMAST